MIDNTKYEIVIYYTPDGSEVDRREAVGFEDMKKKFRKYWVAYYHPAFLVIVLDLSCDHTPR